MLRAIFKAGLPHIKWDRRRHVPAALGSCFCIIFFRKPETTFRDDALGSCFCIVLFRKPVATFRDDALTLGSFLLVPLSEITQAEQAVPAEAPGTITATAASGPAQPAAGPVATDAQLPATSVKSEKVRDLSPTDMFLNADPVVQAMMVSDLGTNLVPGVDARMRQQPTGKMDWRLHMMPTEG